jgi:short-chain fatty acids transporter
MLDALRDLGAGLSRITERWVPDAWVICMILTLAAIALAMLGAGAGIEETVLAWGGGVWKLLELAMQFTLALVAAHACAVSPPVYRWLDRLARLPDPERPLQAVALVGIFSVITGYLNWALTLVACALFVPFVLHRNPRVDVRVLIASAYLGIGTVWQSGLSSSAPLILATPGNPLIAPGTGEPIVDRLYPVTETLFNAFNLGYAALMAFVGIGAALLLHPRRAPFTLPAAEVERMLPQPPGAEPAPDTPAGRVDALRLWVLLATVLLAYPLGHSIATRGFGTSWTINAYNTVFLAAALLLHGRPISFLRACRDGLDAAWGIVLQFPFYGGIFGIMQGTGLGTWLGEVFVSVSSAHSFPWLVYAYSAVLDLFVPSAGSKWLIEAPYLISAGNTLGVSPVTVVLAYAYGDSTANLIHPFWSLPMLAVTGRRFGDVVGYLFLIMLACFAVTSAAMCLIPTRL